MRQVEATARKMFAGAEMPPGWHLNTCLVNFYGDALRDGKRVDPLSDDAPAPATSTS